jgi:hypothetical protein
MISEFPSFPFDKLKLSVTSTVPFQAHFKGVLLPCVLFSEQLRRHDGLVAEGKTTGERIRWKDIRDLQSPIREKVTSWVDPSF